MPASRRSRPRSSADDRLIDELWGAEPPREAANALQYHVSRLRKLLAPEDMIVTREPGYLIRVHPDQLDLLRFERLVASARDTSPEESARVLREALDLWRGPPLAGLSSEPFARHEIQRLEELRLVAFERRIDADLALGRRAELVAELESLVREHPYREPLRAQLMLALYGCGRQSEALDVYRDTRRLLVDELGIEPGTSLQELQQAILRQDPALDGPGGAMDDPRPKHGVIVVVVRGQEEIGGLLAVAEPLARNPPRELIVARLLDARDDVASASAALADERSALVERGVKARVAAYTTDDPGGEAALLATQHDASLLLIAAPSGLLADSDLAPPILAALDRAPCDVAMVSATALGELGPIVTPFGGGEHEWAAIELAAWIAGSLGTSLRLVGMEADEARGRRDASRLLARASMLVQQLVGIVTEPVLVPAGAEGIYDAAGDARLLVVGLSERWRAEGIGATRLELVARADVPTLFVRRGLRPSGVAPAETLTRFTWSLSHG